MDTIILFILLSSSTLMQLAAAERHFTYVKNPYFDWPQAQAYCRERYTDLVSVHDDDETLQLVELADEWSQCIWIGLRHNLDAWRWSMGGPHTDGGDPLWADGQPNNSDGNQDCAMISNAQGSGLQDKACTETYYFICFDGDAAEKYILRQESKTWHDAQEYCRTHYDDLASIHSEDLSQILLLLTDLGVPRAWIGLYRDPWSTWSDNSSNGFDNWDTHPNIYTSNEQCGCLWDMTGKWKELPCNNYLSFFCYGAGTQSTTTSEPQSTVTTDSAAATVAAATIAATATATAQAKVDARKQTILTMNLQSEMDLNSKEIQYQILEQMKNRLGAVGEANFTMKWRATRKTANP